jgi:Kdo2-lipid IVA lauroyltransferase/acyltransferase
MLKINSKAIVYYLVYPFIIFISILPLRLLYFISDVILYPLIYIILGYRKAVVRKNISNAFPEKSLAEQRSIEKKFYHFLCDLFIETLKCITISKSQLQKRCRIEVDTELTDKWYDEKRDFLITLGHYGNYEWLAALLDVEFKHLGTGPYHQMKNPYFNNLFKKMRSRFGTFMYPTFETYRLLQKGFDKTFFVTLANDQSAPPTKSYWTTFLNQDTSFFYGTEKIAKKYDMPVLFAKIRREKRGMYVVSFELITEYPQKEEPGFILEKHATLLEQQIKANPSFWLWSHKRWKHKKPALEDRMPIL